MNEEIKVEDSLNFERKKKKKPKPVENQTSVATSNGEDTLDFGMKKKKKLKNLELGGSDVGDAPIKEPTDVGDSLTEELKLKKKKKVVINEDVNELAEMLDEELSFGLTKKKKKAKALDADASEIVRGESNFEAVAKESVDSSGFTYDMLLTRVFTQMGLHNPELVSDQKRRLVMVPPQMARIGTKKTLFVNYATICRLLNRDPNHLTAYILAELGTQGSVDANGALLFRGRYMSKHMEPVLRNYCRNYVLCGTCQSSETDLCKDSRLLFLHCRRCGSRITVKTVTSGFQAVTGKRAAIRAKTQ